MAVSKKDQIHALLKSIETGDPGPVAVVNEARYIQHNPQTHEGSEGLAALFKRLSKTEPRVNIVRAFETAISCSATPNMISRAARSASRCSGSRTGEAVEHWDNIQERQGPNAIRPRHGGWTNRGGPIWT